MTGQPIIGQLYTYADAGSTTIRRADELVRLGAPIVWDSGAYTAHTKGRHIDPEDHARWVLAQRAKHPDATRLRFIGLDVIGNPAATLDNYRAQRGLGAVVEPTATYGATGEDIDRLLAVADTEWVNVGGLVGKDASQIAAFIAYVRRRIPPEVKVHALGVTNPTVARRVPLDGMDSSSWLTWAQFRRLGLFDDRRGRWEVFHGDVSDWNRIHRRGQWLRDEYGVTAEDLLAPTTADLTARMTLTQCAAMHLFAGWVNRLHSCDTTTYLANEHGGSKGAHRYLTSVYLAGSYSDLPARFIGDHYTPPTT